MRTPYLLLLVLTVLSFSPPPARGVEPDRERKARVALVLAGHDSTARELRVSAALAATVVAPAPRPVVVPKTPDPDEPAASKPAAKKAQAEPTVYDRVFRPGVGWVFVVRDCPDGRCPLTR